MSNLEKENFICSVVERIKGVLPANRTSIALHEPCFTGNELKYVTDCIESGWVSSVGKYVDRFERYIAKFAGVKRAIATVNGTAALHIALILSGVEADDEVLVPALTFVATANAVKYCQAKPHFVESARSSLGIDVAKLDEYLQNETVLYKGKCTNRSSGRTIRAIVPMHTFGHPVDLDELKELCDKYSIVLIEDCAESIGSYYKGKHTGNWGLMSAVSFNGNKIITTGGGGAVLTNDDHLADRAKHITTQAKLPHRWEFIHDLVGYNYRLPNINAALGCAQIEGLPKFIEQKRNIAKKYIEAFNGFSGMEMYIEQEHTKSNYWLNAMILNKKTSIWRDDVLLALNDAGFMSRPVWNLLYKLPMYKDYPRMNCEIAEELAASIINLPSSAGLLYE